MSVRAVLLAALSVAAGATLASAESPGTTPAAQKSAAYLQAGFSSASSITGSGAIGGMIVRDLGPRVALEGSGAYLGRSMGAGALSLSASLLIHLRPGGEKAVPYLAVGGGLYHASSDRGKAPMAPGMTGSLEANGSNGGMMGGTMPHSPGGAGDFGQMPMFDHSGNMMEQGSRPGHQASTDPAVSLGGGIRIDVGANLFLRPDARALIVTSDGGAQTVGVFTVNLGYRF